ncbi:MAG: hypothetical protein ACOYKA_06775, partial [Legionellaceae bacterium]
ASGGSVFRICAARCLAAVGASAPRRGKWRVRQWLADVVDRYHLSVDHTFVVMRGGVWWELNPHDHMHADLFWFGEWEGADADLRAFETASSYSPHSVYSAPHHYAPHSQFSNSLMVSLCVASVVMFNIDSLQAVPLDTLRAPMTAMKNEVWSYMYVVKVAAALMGGLMSVVQQNLMPLGIGGGIAAGIHFFDGVIGDGSAALIGF